jgi:protein-disulfide isomerase
LKRFAADLGLDTSSFNECFDSGKFREDVQRDYVAGGALGVNATPAFFVNGRFLSGAQPFEAFKVLIDEELEK